LKTLKRFFDDIHRIADCIAANRTQDVLVTLKPEQLKDLPFYSKRQAKKEVQANG